MKVPSLEQIITYVCHKPYCDKSVTPSSSEKLCAGNSDFIFVEMQPSSIIAPFTESIRSYISRLFCWTVWQTKVINYMLLCIYNQLVNQAGKYAVTQSVMLQESSTILHCPFVRWEPIQLVWIIHYLVLQYLWEKCANLEYEVPMLWENRRLHWKTYMDDPHSPIPSSVHTDHTIESLSNLGLSCYSAGDRQWKIVIYCNMIVVSVNQGHIRPGSQSW